MRFDTTETMRTAIQRAEAEARELNQEFVATEHLMLALLSGDPGEAARVLQSAVTMDHARAGLSATLPRGAAPPMVTGQLPFSPKAQRTIATATALSHESGESRVSTRFLLLALLDDTQSIVARTLSRSGADLDALQAALRRKPADPET